MGDIEQDTYDQSERDKEDRLRQRREAREQVLRCARQMIEIVMHPRAGVEPLPVDASLELGMSAPAGIPLLVRDKNTGPRIPTLLPSLTSGSILSSFIRMKSSPVPLMSVFMLGPSSCRLIN